MIRILYFGDGFSGSTSGQRAEALKRLGHDVQVLDPYAAFQTNMAGLRGSFHFRTGYAFLQRRITKWLTKVVSDLSRKPDLVWVDMGELFGPSCLSLLNALQCPVVLYNIDDPSGPRDGRRFLSLLKALPQYDLVAVVRDESVVECRNLGAKDVIRVYRNYDEVIHKPFDDPEEIPVNLRSEVAFIGTWMRYEKRDEFLLHLVKAGIPVSIWGNRWEKSPLFEQLKSSWRGNALFGRDYVAAIQGSKVCIGMLSKGNRDLHTTRSLEIPFAGGLFCGERTSEHLHLYEENMEAVFWDDADECSRVIKKLLADNTRREQIRLRGMQKVRSLRLGHEDMCKALLDRVLPTEVAANR